MLNESLVQLVVAAAAAAAVAVAGIAAPKVMKINLIGNADRAVLFKLDTITEQWSEERRPNPDSEDRTLYSGFADKRYLGLFPPSAKFVAVYQADEKLFLRIGDDIWDISTPNLRLKRRTVFPFIKSFEIYRDGSCVFQTTYLCSDLGDDGHSYTFDLLNTVAEAVHTAQDRLERFRPFRVDVS